MTKKPRRGKGGRKKFSAGKQLGPDKSLQANLDVAAIGEFALDLYSREIFGLVALWQKWNTLPPQPAGERYARARDMIQARRVAHANETLLKLLRPALDRIDPKPFKTFVKAIALVEDLNRNGALLADAHEILRVAEEMNLEPRADVVQLVTAADFKKKLRRKVGERQFRRICKRVELHFKPGKPGRPRKPRTTWRRSV